MESSRILLISLCTTSAMLSVIFLLAWYRFGRKSHLLTWSVAFAFATLQWLGNIYIAHFPTRATYLLTVNTLSLLVISAGLHGFRQWAGRKNILLELFITGTLVLLLLAWYTFIDSNQGFQMALSPAYAGLLLLWIGEIIFTSRKSGTRSGTSREMADWALLVVTGLFALEQLGAAACGLLYGVTADTFYAATYHLINFVGMPASLTGMGMFTLLLVASDMFRQLEEQAVTDQLTGLYNRRGFDLEAGQMLSRSRRYRTELSLIVTDIDYFKTINDHYGHVTGDEALCQFAEILKSSMRLEDCVSRLGGEEFALMLPDTCLQEAMMTALRIKDTIEESRLSHKQHKINLTSSFGVAELRPEDKTVTDLLYRADQALYQAKEAGRNQVKAANGQATTLPMTSESMTSEPTDSPEDIRVTPVN